MLWIMFGYVVCKFYYQKGN